MLFRRRGFTLGRGSGSHLAADATTLKVQDRVLTVYFFKEVREGAEFWSPDWEYCSYRRIGASVYVCREEVQVVFGQKV